MSSAPKAGGRTTNNSAAAALETPLPVVPNTRSSGSRSSATTGANAKKDSGRQTGSPAPSSPTTPTNRTRPTTSNPIASPSSQPEPPKGNTPASPASGRNSKKQKNSNAANTPNAPNTSNTTPLISSPLASNRPVNSPSQPNNSKPIRPGSGSSSTPTQASVTTPTTDAAKPAAKPKAPPERKVTGNAAQSQPVESQRVEPAVSSFLENVPVESTPVTSESTLSATPPWSQNEGFGPPRPFPFLFQEGPDPVRTSRSPDADPITSQSFESVTAGLRVARKSKDERGNSSLLVGPGNSYSPRDEPLTASVARFHASWNPDQIEEDPLTPFGALHGLLPRRSAEETMWVRELIIRVSYPHTGNFWRNLPEAVEETVGMIITRQDLIRVPNPLGPDAVPWWGLAMEYLEQLAHVALAVSQCLDAFHSFNHFRRATHISVVIARITVSTIHSYNHSDQGPVLPYLCAYKHL
ncbi:hypothetical protein BDZ89DRAFT_1125192 [Hymenopellis radicata]|nr:hypothetical protein BDZ89DRAFT_1125192 [Hymenopellis radicata]